MPSPPSEKDIDACRRCSLWERATHGVAGEGPREARMMLVGEQPGDEEDLQGRPFVGPAGRLLRRAMADAGITPEETYVTNAVKHFSWEPRCKRRIHKTPAQREIAACHDWLDAELAAVRPAVVEGGARVIATYHPSAVLRAPEGLDGILPYGAPKSILHDYAALSIARAPHAARRALKIL